MEEEMILIADDNSSMRQTIKAILQDVETEFGECGDGPSAVEFYSRHHPAWVLMDVMMPGMDGIAATRKITDRFPEAKIIIVTNYDDLLLREEAKAAGATDFIVKDDLSLLPAILSSSH